MTVLTDGRKQYISEALPTWIDAYGNDITYKFIIDDSGDYDYRHWLIETFPEFAIIPVGNKRCGYSKAMQTMFDIVKDFDMEYNLHIEDDFVLLDPPSLSDMCEVLSLNEDISQMSLMRKPWYGNEIQHGGVIEALEVSSPQPFIQENTNGHYWVRHSAYWTANPSVFPQWLAHREWPEAPWCEMKFNHALKNDEIFNGIWGHRDNWVCVEHIGKERNGIEY